MVMWHVENILYLEMTHHQNQKVGFVETQRLVLCWKWQPITHQGKYGVEIRIESSSQDGSHSWIRISNGLNKFVRDLTEKVRIHEDNEDTLAGTEETVTRNSRPMQNSRMSIGKLAAKARPRQASAHSSSTHPKSIPIHSRKWIDVEPKEQHDKSYPIAKRMNTLLRHEPRPRDEDGAIEFRRLKLQFDSRFPNSVYGSIRSWINHLGRGGGHKKIFQFCTDHIGGEILYVRVLHGHSGENPVDPSLPITLEVISTCTILNSGLTAGGRDAKRERQTVFFTAADPMAVHLHEQEEFADLLLTSRSGRYARLQCIGSVSGSLKERD